MSDAPWIDAEILDNPTGEVTDEDVASAEAEEEALAAEVDGGGEVVEEASEPADDDPDDLGRQRDGILKELRETRDELKKERQANAERNQVLEQRLQALFEAREKFSKEEEQAPSPPDPNEDPLGALQYQQEQIAAQQRQMLEQYQSQQAQAQQQQQVQELVGRVRKIEEEFVQSKGLGPEQYDAAIDFARDQVKSYYTSLGVDEAQADQMAQVEQLQFTAEAIKRGLNPAEARYNFAVSRGFSPPQKEEGEASEQAAQGVDKESLAKTLQFKQQAVGESKSLGAVSGAAGKRRITLEELANAPADLFDKITNDPSLWEKINVEGSLVV